MKLFKISLLLFVTNIFVYSQSIDPLYEVGTWQGFRSCAISYTFDDGCANQFTKAIPIFDEFGFKLTLFTVINGQYVGTTTNWLNLQKIADKGHEIASHTLTHPHLGTLKDSMQTLEIKNSRDEIEKHIQGQKCITIAYPYCETGNVNISKKNHIAARICSGSIKSKTPADFFNISSIICGTQGSIKTTKDFNNKANSAVNMKGWVVYLLHGIDSDGGYSPVNSDTLKESIRYLYNNPTKFWVSSFGNVARYIRERNNAKVDETSVSDSVLTVQVTDTLDNAIYNIPVTIRRELPADWESAQVIQNGRILSSQMTEATSKKYVMFDVVPDSGEIQIVKSITTGVYNYRSELTPTLKQNYPNPFNPTTTLSYVIDQHNSVSLKVFDILGDEVATLVNEQKPAGLYTVQFNGKDFPSGIYFYRIVSGGFTSTKKLILLK